MEPSIQSTKLTEHPQRRVQFSTYILGKLLNALKESELRNIKNQETKKTIKCKFSWLL